jgi:cytoskeletal protein CcmA (bactofilin family)
LKNATIGGPVSSGSGGDIGGTADDVRIDGDLVSGNDIDIINSVVAGKLKADGNIGTLKSTDVGGSVVTGDGGDIGGTVSDVKIGGSIRCGNDLDITDSTVCGILNVGGNVATFRNTSVGGSVIAGGGETFSDVDGIDPADDLADSDIGGTARDIAVFGDLLAGNDIDITNAKIEDRIAAAGNVTIKDGDPVEVGDVVTTDSGSTITVESGATLSGDIDTEGDVTVNGEVVGDVSADGDVEGSGTITGTDPRSSNEEN